MAKTNAAPKKSAGSPDAELIDQLVKQLYDFRANDMAPKLAVRALIARLARNSESVKEHAKALIEMCETGMDDDSTEAHRFCMAVTIIVGASRGGGEHFQTLAKDAAHQAALAKAMAQYGPPEESSELPFQTRYIEELSLDSTENLDMLVKAADHFMGQLFDYKATDLPPPKCVRALVDAMAANSADFAPHAKMFLSMCEAGGFKPNGDEEGRFSIATALCICLAHGRLGDAQEFIEETHADELAYKAYLICQRFAKAEKPPKKVTENDVKTSLTKSQVCYAEGCEGYAKSSFNVTLDFTIASVNKVEQILGDLEAALKAQQLDQFELAMLLESGDTETIETMFGAYIGETIRRNFGGGWQSLTPFQSAYRLESLTLTLRAAVANRLMTGADASIVAYTRRALIEASRNVTM